MLNTVTLNAGNYTASLTYAAVGLTPLAFDAYVLNKAVNAQSLANAQSVATYGTNIEIRTITGVRAISENGVKLLLFNMHLFDRELQSITAAGGITGKRFNFAKDGRGFRFRFIWPRSYQPISNIPLRRLGQSTFLRANSAWAQGRCHPLGWPDVCSARG